MSDYEELSRTLFVITGSALGMYMSLDYVCGLVVGDVGL